MSRLQLDRSATTGERLLGAAMVSLLALSLAVASFYIWLAAFRSESPDPFLIALSILAAAGCVLLLKYLYTHLSQAPTRHRPATLMLAACTLLLAGLGSLALAILQGSKTPHIYATAAVSIAMGARHILAMRRR